MNDKNKQDHLRQIPAVDEILNWPKIVKLSKTQPHWIILKAIRNTLENKRKEFLKNPSLFNNEGFNLSMDQIINGVEKEIKKLAQPSLRRVINATGIILHTNIGRAVLSSEALNSLIEIGGSYSNLEFDLEKGERGSRYTHVEKLLCQLTNAESAMVVNNNAGAVLLTLNTLAFQKEVIIPRGQLIEIGDSFRIPEIMEKSGAILKEIGATNKTHLRDYQSEIGENTGLLLKVHTSNYRIVGFTAEVSLEELVELGKKHNIPVMEDLGSGCLINLSRYNLEAEPTVQETVKAGVDVVTFSGDKLLGGPQAGIIIGKEKYISSIKKNPLTRALRIDKLTLAALEATLYLYLDQENAARKIPTLKMLTMSDKEINQKVKKMMAQIKKISPNKIEAQIEENNSQVGGGALPSLNLPTKTITLKPITVSVEKLEKYFRLNNPPILTRIQKDKLLLDMRTIQDREIEDISKAIERFEG